MSIKSSIFAAKLEIMPYENKNQLICNDAQPAGDSRRM